MGTMTALFAARRGAKVVLFEKNSRIMQGASRFNEGKIHLGCLYSASPTLETAKLVLPGGLHFQHLCEEILERKIDTLMSPEDDIYAVHEESVAKAETVRAYIASIAELVADHPDRHLCRHDVSAKCFKTLSMTQVRQFASDRIVAAFSVPERSVATQVFADWLETRTLEDPSIEVRTSHTVLSASKSDDDLMQVTTDRITLSGFNSVVNALWEGRPAVDKASVGRTDPISHHRFRLSAFLKNAHARHPSAVVCTGAFGDIKNYGQGQYYVSWYPAGLIAESETIDPPPFAPLTDEEERNILIKIAKGLGDALPGVPEIFETSSECHLRGGWVYAQASGRLQDPTSSLHHRELMGVYRSGQYYSVDTGKFSTAPLIAKNLASRITDQ